MTTAVPSSRGWAMGAGGWIIRSPRRSRPRPRMKGELTASGWIAEQTSWWKPGRVRSAVRQPPPGVSEASSTSTERPARARVMAAASPLGPAPTTTASSGAAAVAGPASGANVDGLALAGRIHLHGPAGEGPGARQQGVEEVVAVGRVVVEEQQPARPGPGRQADRVVHRRVAEVGPRPEFLD